MIVTKIRGACPYCYRQMVAAKDPFSDETPMHGDLALCGGCGAFNVFDFTRRANTLRKPTAQERLAIDRNAHAARLLRHKSNGAAA